MKKSLNPCICVRFVWFLTMWIFRVIGDILLLWDERESIHEKYIKTEAKFLIFALSSAALILLLSWIFLKEAYWIFVPLMTLGTYLLEGLVLFLWQKRTGKNNYMDI